jgi:hypothetical protein
MSNEFEYYLIGGDGNFSAPSLKTDEGYNYGSMIGDEPKEIELMKLCFRNPVPKKPQMLDFHFMVNSVISKKIYDVLAPMNIYGVQFIPAVVRNNKTNELYENYFCVYIYNKITCLDMEHSKYTISPLDGKVTDIRNFSLDNKKLSEIPLEKRLVFLLKEDIAKRIYHKSVVDAILSINPEGIQFGKITEWHEGIQFP